RRAERIYATDPHTASNRPGVSGAWVFWRSFWRLGFVAQPIEDLLLSQLNPVRRNKMLSLCGVAKVVPLCGTARMAPHSDA
ncbi:MAG TPA: hypothetical protein VK096_01495, partial [Actinomycetales bacterium]|nr:hypothetical protein [Actinomycetales bacterium]